MTESFLFGIRNLELVVIKVTIENFLRKLRIFVLKHFHFEVFVFSGFSDIFTYARRRFALGRAWRLFQVVGIARRALDSSWLFVMEGEWLLGSHFVFLPQETMAPIFCLTPAFAETSHR